MNAKPPVIIALFVLSLLLLVAPGNGCADNLFVDNSGNNTIEEFNSSGVGTVFASFSSEGVGFLAFQPVPEPSTWALLAGGLMALVPLRRRSDKV